ncbi:hypothetical protein C8Q76DRAFT_693069 [Earliella scabrosa]|nr:hypothetical protein C8Q76DRAFT_693069 [Earliella scabrosa]
MSSAPLTYLYRVRKLFSELAKAGQSSIQLDRVIAIVCPQEEEDREELVDVAVMHEAQYISVRRSGKTATITLTDEGIAHYKEWEDPVPMVPSPRSRRDAVAEYQSIAELMLPILTSLRARSPNDTRLSAMDDVVDVVKEHLQSTTYWREMNEDLRCYMIAVSAATRGVVSPASVLDRLHYGRLYTA